MKKICLTCAVLAFVFTGCKNENREQNDTVNTDTETEMENTSTDDEDKKHTVSIVGKSGSDVSGNAVFTQENGEVTMTAVVEGLSEGQHAIHLHENADCSADDASSAGGHWNPTFEKHGKWGDPEGYHRGDIGNFKVDANGNGTITMTTDQWCIGCDDETKNIIGKSVVVHDGVDDFTSQPAGDAGDRFGCGEITE